MILTDLITWSITMFHDRQSYFSHDACAVFLAYCKRPGFPWRSRGLLWIWNRWGPLWHVPFRWASINNASSSPFIAIISSDLGPPTLNYSYRAMKRRQRKPFKRQMSIQHAKMFPATEMLTHHAEWSRGQRESTGMSDERVAKGPPSPCWQSLLGNFSFNPLSDCLQLA